MIKVGMGYDVHAILPGKPLLIGGVKVSSSKGSVGHSDGDALVSCNYRCNSGRCGTW